MHVKFSNSTKFQSVRNIITSVLRGFLCAGVFSQGFSWSFLLYREFDYCSFTLKISIHSKKGGFYVVLSRFSCLVLALVLKISSHQVVMFHIECQFTGTHRPRQKISAYLGM